MYMLRVLIQEKVTELLENGTFPRVVYTAGRDPDADGTSVSPKSVVVNEVSGGLTDSSQYGATGFGFVLRDWRFECRAEFTTEVDVSYFLLEELRKITFNVENLVVSIVPAGDFRVTHPPRDGSHNGTKLIVGLTVNTRR